MIFSTKVTNSVFYTLTFLIIAGVLASLALFSWQPHLFGFFLLLEYSILFLSVLCFRVNSSNFKYYLSQGLIALPCFILLYIKKFNVDPSLGLDDSFVYLGLSYFGVILLILFFCFLNYLGKPKLRVKKKELFMPRMVDLERITSYLEKFNIVGIDGKWGDGKTFLFRKLEQKLKDKYHFTRIGVLSTTCDSVEKIVISEIHSVLRKEGIFSVATVKWNDFLDQSFLHKVGDFFKYDSFTEIVRRLLDDAAKLEKPILISFEDIDRIQSPDVLYKIFAIADTISCDKIKVLYQYDESLLMEFLGYREENEVFGRLYLEKYIPHRLSMQRIPFYQIIDFLLKDGNYKRVKLEYFDRLKDKQVKIDELFCGTDSKTNAPKPFEVEASYDKVSIRRVELFLDEIDAVLLTGRGDPQAVIGLFVAKFFMPEIYKRLDSNLDLKKIALFNMGTTEADLTTMLSNQNSNEIVYDGKEKILLDSIRFYVNDRNKYATYLNSNAFLFFKLIGYDFREVLYHNINAFDPTEDLKLEKIMDQNDHIQRTIKYWKGVDFRLDEDNQELLKWLRRLFFGEKLDSKEKAFEKLIMMFPPKFSERPFQSYFDKLCWCDCTSKELKELFDFSKYYYHDKVTPLLSQIDSNLLQKDDTFCAHVLNSINKDVSTEKLDLDRNYWWLIYELFLMIENKYGITLKYEDDSLEKIESTQAKLANNTDIHLSWFREVFNWFNANPTAVNNECITTFLQQALQFLQPPN